MKTLELSKKYKEKDPFYYNEEALKNNISEILEYKENIQKEIYEIENLEDYIKSLKINKKQRIFAF